MTQATDDPGVVHDGDRPGLPALVDLASSPTTAALLSSLFELLQGVKRRGAAAAGTGQLLVALVKSGPACGADLASSLHLDQSTVSRHLSALEADGLIRRTASAQDRRVHQVELTERGRTQAHGEVARRVALLEAAVADWPESDVVTLSQLLARFVADLRSSEEGTPQ